MSNLGVQICITLMEAEHKHLLCSFVDNGFPSERLKSRFLLQKHANMRHRVTTILFLVQERVTIWLAI